MKNRVIEKINNSYIYVAILVVYIVVILIVSLLLAKTSVKEMDLVLNGSELELNDGIIKIKKIRYITRDDIEKNFGSHVFYDKISRTLIITTWDEKIKIKKGAEGTVEHEAETVYSVKMLAEKLGYTYVEDTKTNDIYIYNNIEQEVKLKKNRTEVYSLNGKNVVGVVDKASKIMLLETDSVYTDSKETLVTLKITEQTGKTYIARIRKDKISYVSKTRDTGLDKQERITMVCVENKLGSETDLSKVNALAVSMLKLTGSNKVEKAKYILPSTKGIDVYAVIDNEYKSAGFDTNIITDLIHSDKNKETVATYIINFVLENNLEGVIIDFKKFKTADKDLLEQYIKELAVVMHKNDKKLIVKMMTIETYDVQDIKDFVDFILVEGYGTRTTSSKQAGTHSSVNYIIDIISWTNDNKIASKVILEIPTYSILWTERGGIVINAEIYSMKAAQEYIEENNIEVIYNKATRQNYASYTKGIITYKMWLEDLESFEEKHARAYVNGLAGTSIYKSGDELKEIYNILNNEDVVYN